MTARPAAVFLCIALAACGSSSPFRSASEARADDLLYALETDLPRYGLEHEEALADAEVREKFLNLLFDRALELSAESRREVFPDDPARREQIRILWTRTRDALLRLREPAARVCIERLTVLGPPAALASDLLSLMDQSSVRAPIADALASPELDFRRAGIRAAEDTKTLAEFEPALTKFLEDEDWRLRRDAAAALASLSDDLSRAALLRTLHDKNLLVAREAALALGRRKVREAGDGLFEFLKRAVEARDPTAADAALTALQELSGRKDLKDKGADLAAWRVWVAQNRPISESAPSRPAAVESQPAQTQD